jgi:hypothetical protein
MIDAPMLRSSALWAVRLLAAALLVFWAAFLLLPLLGGAAPAARQGLTALGLAAVVVPLGYLVLRAGGRGGPLVIRGRERPIRPCPAARNR